MPAFIDGASNTGVVRGSAQATVVTTLSHKPWASLAIVFADAGAMTIRLTDRASATCCESWLSI
jgi:hypothetical protein